MDDVPDDVPDRICRNCEQPIEIWWAGDHPVWCHYSTGLTLCVNRMIGTYAVPLEEGVFLPKDEKHYDGHL